MQITHLHWIVLVKSENRWKWTLYDVFDIRDRFVDARRSINASGCINSCPNAPKSLQTIPGDPWSQKLSPNPVARICISIYMYIYVYIYIYINIHIADCPLLCSAVFKKLYLLDNRRNRNINNDTAAGSHKGFVDAPNSRQQTIGNRHEATCIYIYTCNI